jgi:hypothetical protein
MKNTLLSDSIHDATNAAINAANEQNSASMLTNIWFWIAIGELLIIILLLSRKQKGTQQQNEKLKFKEASMKEASMKEASERKHQ